LQNQNGSIDMQSAVNLNQRDWPRGARHGTGAEWPRGPSGLLIQSPKLWVLSLKWAVLWFEYSHLTVYHRLTFLRVCTLIPSAPKWNKGTTERVDHSTTLEEGMEDVEIFGKAKRKDKSLDHKGEWKTEVTALKRGWKWNWGICLVVSGHRHNRVISHSPGSVNRR